MFDMASEELTALKMFSQQQDSFMEPQTISLADTDLTTTASQSPEPSSRSESPCPTQDGDDDRKPTKKRKSWGQELPIPKTNLPPRYAELE